MRRRYGRNNILIININNNRTVTVSQNKLIHNDCIRDIDPRNGEITIMIIIHGTYCVVFAGAFTALLNASDVPVVETKSWHIVIYRVITISGWHR